MYATNNFALEEGEIYEISLLQIGKDWQAINLENEAGDVILHISLRKLDSTIILNNKQDLEWSGEVYLDFPLQACKNIDIYLKINSDNIEIYVNKLYLYTYPIVLAELENINSNYQLSILETTLTEDNIINIFNMDIVIPEDLHNEVLLDIINFSILDNSFFETRVFGKNKVIFEKYSNTNVVSIILSKMFPDVIIAPVIQTEETLLSFKALLESNRSENIFLNEIVFNDQYGYMDIINDIENKYHKQIDEYIFFSKYFFQNIFLNKLYKDLTENDKKVSLHIEETNIPNVTNIYFCDNVKHQNIQINISGTRWQLNQFALGEYRQYRQGLDVVVAMYNTPDYIIECVDSILCDDRDDIRVILVNDGSTDNSLDIVQNYYMKNKLVTIVDKHNGGCASARNMGYMMSDASHITFFDSDDIVDKNFFSKLYDLALFSGNEIVQGGFDFYHEGEDQEYIPSYEDAQFKEYERGKFADNDVITIGSDELLLGQPTIWRRVYRRDFLESKNVFFPENIRAYDDYIFHLFSIHYARDILMIPDIKVHYRQHAGQDIKKGDERHFNELYMFRMLIRRSVDEGWPNFEIFANAMVNTIDWSLSILRDDLIMDFIKSSADICAALRKIYGQDVFRLRELDTISHPDFMYYLKESEADIGHLSDGHHWSYFINLYDNPATIKFAKSISKPL